MDANPDERPSAVATARQAFVAAVVVIAVVVTALALWKLRVVLALLLFAFTIAAAMRPGVDRLAGWRVPRAVAVLLHYLVFLGLVALFLSFVVPTLSTQVQHALHTAQTAHSTSHGSSLKERILNAIGKHLQHLPKTGTLVSNGLTIGEKALKALAGIFFTFAVAAYWIFERDRTVDLVASLMPRPRRKKLRDTWTLVDQKLGSFIRGEIILIAFVSVLASVAFVLVGEPYWLLIGISAGIFEIVPVVGPLVAVVVAVGAGLTASWHTAALAGIALLAIRLVEDYLVTPRVLGGAVGLPPLLTLVSVSVTGVLLGSFYVLLSIPLAALVATIVDVVVRGIDPAEVEVPTVLFPAQDAE
ncbi:MAG TPA: AI-2E family transporter [Gaiellaceae bacterium]|nr:AI-2E family transporter [Gaiellaceae bacterium]